MTPEAAQRLLAWVPQAPGWALAALGAALVVVVSLPLWSQGGQPLRRRLTSAGLRGLAACALIPALGGLSSVEVRRLTSRSRVVILVDGSASMQVRDEGETRVQRASDYLVRQRPELERLARRATLEIVWLGRDEERLSLDRLGALPAADGLRTDYLAALEGLSTGEGRPAAAILVGDGADRASLGLAAAAGGDALEALLEEITYPVFTLCVGGEDVADDLRVRFLDHAPFAFLRRPMTVPVQVRGTAPGVDSVQVVLRRDGQVLSTRAVVPARDGGPVQLSFDVTPDQVGYLTLGVEIPVPQGDPLPANNADATTVRVVRDRTRVLQLSSRPSWDVRFVRRFLKTDPNIDLISFFIMREAPFLGRFSSSRLSLIEFPHEQLFGEDLQGFDLVVLQNFSFGSLPRAASLTPAYLEALAEFVEGGGGLLIIGGDRALRRAELAGTGIERVLPCELAPARAGGAEPFHAVPTASGARHPVMRLAGGDGAANERVWASLAPLDGHNVLGPPHPGGVVLATAGEGGDPLIAVRRAGRGRAMVLATDGAWTWTTGEGGATQSPRAALMRNVVRWLVGEEPEGRLVLHIGRETVRPGEEVRAVVELRGPDYQPLAGAPLRLEVQPVDRPGGGDVVLDGETGADGRWSATVPAAAPGTYRVIATEVEGEARAEARFSVRPDLAEFDDAAGRPELLRQLARATGGEVLDADEPLDVARLGPGPRATRSVTEVVPVWDRWWWLVAVAAPLGLDWILRRRWAMG